MSPPLELLVLRRINQDFKRSEDQEKPMVSTVSKFREKSISNVDDIGLI